MCDTDKCHIKDKMVSRIQAGGFRVAWYGFSEEMACELVAKWTEGKSAKIWKNNTPGRRRLWEENQLGVLRGQREGLYGWKLDGGEKEETEDQKVSRGQIIF